MANCTKCGRETTSADGVCGNRARAECERIIAKGAEAPPKTRKVKAAAAPEPAAPDFQKQFFELAGALGLNPEEMLTTYCREWVEKTRARALADE